MKENLIKCLLRTRFLTKIQSMMWCNYDSKIKKNEDRRSPLNGTEQWAQ